MENLGASDVVERLESVVAYAGQLSHFSRRHRSNIGTLNEVLDLLLREGVGMN